MDAPPDSGSSQVPTLCLAGPQLCSCVPKTSAAVLKPVANPIVAVISNPAKVRAYLYGGAGAPTTP